MSTRVEDQTAEAWDGDDVCFADGAPGHRMVSVKVASPAVPFIERCEVCGFIEPDALTAHAENWAKQVLPRRAQRIAVAVETDPFQFVQPPSGELPLLEIMAQSFAALATHVAEHAAKGWATTGKRETSIMRAALAEIERLIRIDKESDANR